MNRSDYLADPHVMHFVAWMTPYVTGERAFRHTWDSPRWGPWSCESLFDAYRRFDWPFAVTLPGEARRTGRSLEENWAVLDDFSRMVRLNAGSGDTDRFFDAAAAIFAWGGVRQNAAKLRKQGTEALPMIRAAAAQLDPVSADTDRFDAVRDLNAGFSKLYALLLDDFPIYDSRVAGAMARFIRGYSEESGLLVVPETLALSVPPAQGRKTRNPSAGSIRFRGMRWRDTKQYATSNVMAAWLLGSLSQESPFGDLDPARRLLALQSAMFMIGYDIDFLTPDDPVRHE